MIADGQTDRQTDRHACRNTPRSPIGGGLVIVTLVDPTVGGVALCMQLRAVQQSIGISCAPGPQPAAGLLLWAHAMAGTDGRTDRRADALPIHRPSSAYYAGSSNKLVARLH